MNRACQVHTTGFDLPDRRMSSAVPQPSAVARITLARHTCFCGALRSATIAYIGLLDGWRANMRHALLTVSLAVALASGPLVLNLDRAEAMIPATGLGSDSE